MALKNTPKPGGKSPRGSSTEAIHVNHQIGMVRRAMTTPQPGGPKLPMGIPPRSHNIVALGAKRQR